MNNAKTLTSASIYAVIGSDRFLRNDAVRTLVQSIGADDALGPARISGDEAQLAEVLDEVRTPSLLGPARVVIVDEADDFISANRESLEKFCASTGHAGKLIFLCDSMPKNTRLYKIIAQHGSIIECSAPQGRALVGWIMQRAKSTHGKSIGEAAAQRLRDHLGDAPGWIDTELSKLATYIGDRPEITTADIEQVTGELREEKVFGVTDAMAAGDTVTALRLWDQVWATDRAAPGRAIAGIAWGVRKLLDARQDLDSGMDIGSVARKLFTDPATARKRLEARTAEELREQQRDLVAADLGVKTGVTTVDSAIEKFIVKQSVRKTEPRRSSGAMRPAAR